MQHASWNIGLISKRKMYQGLPHHRICS